MTFKALKDFGKLVKPMERVFLIAILEYDINLIDVFDNRSLHCKLRQFL